MADKVQYFHKQAFDPPDAVKPNHSFSLLIVVIFLVMVVVVPLYCFFHRRRQQQTPPRLVSVDIEMQSTEPMTASSSLGQRITSFTFDSSSVLRFEEDMCVLCQTEFIHGTFLASIPSCDHTFRSSCITEYILRDDKCPLCRELIRFPIDS